MGTGDSFLRDEVGGVMSRLLLSRAELNAWNYTSTSPYIFMALYGALRHFKIQAPYKTATQQMMIDTLTVKT
jgi:hypothetical protein